MDSFSEFALAAPIAAGLADAGYVRPTPIQAAALPAGLAGRDVLGLAQTGTGKTAAFTLPMLQRLSATGGKSRPGAPRALVLLPTRELALQVGEVVGKLGGRLPLRAAVVHGGVSLNPQIRALDMGVDMLIATPGRLLDLMNQGRCSLEAVEFFVLDEADRMLDMGFLPDVRRVVNRLPAKAKRQTLFFSATMPDAIASLADGLLNDHVRVQVAAPATTVDRIASSVVMVEKGDKAGVLVGLLNDPAVSRAIIFTRTKRGANKLAQQLVAAGIGAEAYHANKSQNARERALGGFKAGTTRAMVATDIAARGIDVDGVTHVFNYDLPEVPETFVHRIGRTGRAGRDGTAISLCTPEDRPLLAAIEKLIRQPLPRITATAAPLPPVSGAATAQPPPRPRQAHAGRPARQPQGKPSSGPAAKTTAVLAAGTAGQPAGRPAARKPDGQAAPAGQARPQGQPRPGGAGGRGSRPAEARPQPAAPAQRPAARPAAGRDAQPKRESAAADAGGAWAPDFLRRPARPGRPA